MSEWKPIETAPKDGTPIIGHYYKTIRYLPYKPEGRRQVKKHGRWQCMNEYGGWENCEPPAEWASEIPSRAPSRPSQDGPSSTAYDDSGYAKEPGQ